MKPVCGRARENLLRLCGRSSAFPGLPRNLGVRKRLVDRGPGSSLRTAKTTPTSPRMKPDQVASDFASDLDGNLIHRIHMFRIQLSRGRSRPVIQRRSTDMAELGFASATTTRRRHSAFGLSVQEREWVQIAREPRFRPDHGNRCDHAPQLSGKGERPQVANHVPSQRLPAATRH